MSETLVRVVAPHFVAGLVIEQQRATVTAPILAWARGKHEDELREAFRRKGWRASIVKERPDVPT